MSSRWRTNRRPPTRSSSSRPADGLPGSPLYLSPTAWASAPAATECERHDDHVGARCPPTRLPAGSYSVEVTDDQGDTQTLPDALTVTAGGRGVLKTSISMPDPIGYHEPSTIYVTYSNIGTAPMDAPLLVLTATQNGEQGAFLSLDPSDAGLGYWTNTTPAGFSQTVSSSPAGRFPHPRARREHHRARLLRRLAPFPMGLLPAADLLHAGRPRYHQHPDPRWSSLKAGPFNRGSHK